MPLIQETPDLLPYIDAAPSEQSITTASALIHDDLRRHATTELHKSIPTMKESFFSSSMQAELERVGAGQAKLPTIDLTRYDMLDAPKKGDLSSWRTTLQQACASSEYLRGRELNLALLETYGKNAWLISNSQQESILHDLEREVDAAKTELEMIENERRAVQGNAAGEMQNLNDTWRQGIGRMIEAQAAGERLRQEILDRRRHGIT